MPDVRDLAERLWNGEASTADHHPVHERIAEGQEIAEGLLFYKGIASANTIDTGDANLIWPSSA